MDWIKEHLQLVIAIAGAVAYWLNQRKQEQPEAEEAAPERSFEDPQLAERTRRIREEIQRKIARRANGPVAPEAPSEPTEPAELPPIFREIFLPQAPRPAPARSAPTQAEATRVAEVLAQQATLAEQLKQAKELKAAVERRAQFESASTDRSAVAVMAQTGALRDDLRNPAALRRAFVLREVLGPPVALRP